MGFKWVRFNNGPLVVNSALQCDKVVVNGALQCDKAVVNGALQCDKVVVNGASLFSTQS